jgi:hypothetical protein
MENAQLTSPGLTFQAELSSTDLAGANLDGEKLAGVVYDGRTHWPNGFNPARHGANLVK